jgi:hypothetical protein
LVCVSFAPRLLDPLDKEYNTYRPKRRALYYINDRLAKINTACVLAQQGKGDNVREVGEAAKVEVDNILRRLSGLPGPRFAPSSKNPPSTNLTGPPTTVSDESMNSLDSK